MATTYGYARCSTNDTMQDVNRQVRELVEAGADQHNIFHEYEHGTTEHKKEQEAMFAKLAEGDTLIVTEISRLTRSTKQLCEIIDTVKGKRLKLVILNSVTIDCRNGEIDPMTAAFLQMAGVFAELERGMISARVKSGMQNAKAKGKKIGRPETKAKDLPETFTKFLPMYTAKQINKVEFARLAGLTRPTIDKYLKLAGI